MQQVSQPPHSEALWRMLTQQANAAYAQQHTLSAHAKYTEAMTKAEEMLQIFQETGAPLSAPLAFVISCHNLADCLETQKQTDQAAHFLRYACTKLTHLAQRPELPLQARLACVEHLRPAVNVLSEQSIPSLSHQQDIQNLIAQARTAALKVYQVASYAVQTRLEDAPVTERPS